MPGAGASALQFPWFLGNQHCQATIVHIFRAPALEDVLHVKELRLIVADSGCGSESKARPGQPGGRGGSAARPTSRPCHTPALHGLGRSTSCGMSKQVARAGLGDARLPQEVAHELGQLVGRVVGRSPDQCCKHPCPTLTARESGSITGPTAVHGRLPPEAVLGPRFTAGPAVRSDHGSVAALAADARRIAQLLGRTPLKRQGKKLRVTATNPT